MAERTPTAQARALTEILDDPTTLPHDPSALPDEHGQGNVWMGRNAAGTSLWTRREGVLRSHTYYSPREGALHIGG